MTGAWWLASCSNQPIPVTTLVVGVATVGVVGIVIARVFIYLVDALTRRGF